MPEVSASDWDAFVAGQSGVHLLQTSGWGAFKQAFGWQAVRLISGEAGAQILFRKLPLGFSLAYIPKGPVGQTQKAFWDEAEDFSRRQRAVFLRVEPDAWQPEGELARPENFLAGAHAVQPQRTIVISLEGNEDTLQARMKQKTRYNIRLAERRGVQVRSSDRVDLFYEMMTITGSRDNFGVHSQPYYQAAYDIFHPAGACELLMAEYEGETLAGLMVFQHQGRAWYFYGASTEAHRNLMPTYLLQWEAMRWARAQGCRIYDLWGVPDEDERVLEDEFTSRSDGLWGVYRFKRGFGGDVRRSAGPWDRVYHQLLYGLYQWSAGRED
jgi:lipid II:glycine glycyltransferase (peptidoglycan interpeptide bridge formation enzyme)